ncbi:uncharacterized protein LOC130640850 [Hydractinia symbiolongicarpus]|uniref:uncharacterized protein LOC130640850 n=1 Tax=Hydractinia symbiolongicarpus TaxID=13093 RepID=UPI00254B952B|nr:uncharacterized protein LOC130640850 [Hydractinia symbiolongicarpus]
MLIEGTFVVSISISLLLFTLLAWFVNRQYWRERDGILLYDAFVIDALFSLCTILLFADAKGDKIFTNMYVFLSLMSWANRSLIAINRYIVITYSLHYESILRRSTLIGLVILLWISTSTFAVLSYLFSTSWLPPSRGIFLMFFAAWLSRKFLIAVVVVHVIFVVVVNVMEFLSWRTDMGFQSKVFSTIIGRMRTFFRNPYRSFDIHVQIDDRETRGRKCMGTTSWILLLTHIIIITPFLGTLSHFVITGTDVFEEAHFKVVCTLSNVLMAFKPLITISENLHIEDSKALKHSLIDVCCRKNQQVDAPFQLTEVTSQLQDPSLLGFSPEFGMMTTEHREEILQLRRECLEFRKKRLMSSNHSECPVFMETVL